MSFKWLRENKGFFRRYKKRLINLTFKRFKLKTVLTHTDISFGIADALAVEGLSRLQVALRLEFDVPDPRRPHISVEQQVNVLNLCLGLGEEVLDLVRGSLEGQPVQTQNNTRHGGEGLGLSNKN